jgi:hypothetical protein
MKISAARLCIAAALIASGSSAPAADEGATKNPPAKDKTTTKPAAKPASGAGAKEAKPEEAGQGLAAFGKVLPLGEENIDVRIPSFRDGAPSSTIRAQTMTRVEENRMDMVKLDIRMFDSERLNDLVVQLPTASFDMSTSVLSSRQRGRISREDFQLEGDTLIFDTISGQGKMTGHIQMIIWDTNALNKKPDAAAPAPKDGSGAATPPKEAAEKKP